VNNRVRICLVKNMPFSTDQLAISAIKLQDSETSPWKQTSFGIWSFSGAWIWVLGTFLWRLRGDARYLVLLLIPAMSSWAAEPKPASTVAELQQQLREYISQSKYAAAWWGVKVVSL